MADHSPISIAVPPRPPLDFVSDGARRRALRQAKAIATGAVAFAALAFVAARFLPIPEFWRRLIGAAGEAGTVGGLADWFAVTALFRHPLGIPIPHTALIPARKNEIGRALARFVVEHFLDPGQLVIELRKADRADQIGAWLERPDAARFLADRLCEALPHVLATVDDRRVRSAVLAFLRGRVNALEPGPFLASTLQILIEERRHLDLVDALLPALRVSVEASRDALVRAIGRRTTKWVPEFVDRRLAEAVSGAVIGALDAVGTPGTDERAAIDRWITGLVAELPELAELDRFVATVKRLVLGKPALRAVTAEIWREIEAGLIGRHPDGTPRLRDAAARAIANTGVALRAAAPARHYLDAALERVLLDYIAPWREQIGRYIETKVASWDARDATRIIELQVGRDLQYVRLNGTLIGALIGVGLFLASWFAGFS